MLDTFLCHAVGGVGNPALGAPGQGVAEESVVDDADVGVFGEVVAVDCEAAWLHVAGQIVGDGREEAQCLVNAGLEAGA